MAIALNSKFKLNKDLVLIEVNGGVTLVTANLSQPMSKMLQMNSTAGIILKQIVSGQTLLELLDAMNNDFTDIDDEQVKKDVLVFIENLLNNGIIFFQG